MQIIGIIKEKHLQQAALEGVVHVGIGILFASAKHLSISVGPLEMAAYMLAVHILNKMGEYAFRKQAHEDDKYNRDESWEHRLCKSSLVLISSAFLAGSFISGFSIVPTVILVAISALARGVTLLMREGMKVTRA